MLFPHFEHFVSGIKAHLATQAIIFSDLNLTNSKVPGRAREASQHTLKSTSVRRDKERGGPIEGNAGTTGEAGSRLLGENQDQGKLDSLGVGSRFAVEESSHPLFRVHRVFNNDNSLSYRLHIRSRVQSYRNHCSIASVE